MAVRAVQTCWREAMANLFATPYRFALVGVVLAAALSFVGSREATLVHALAGEAVQQRMDGRDIVVVTGRSAPVAGIACDRLASLGGVRAAGTLRADGQAVVPTNPQSGYDAFVASPGMADVLTVRAGTSGVLVGGAMARELGLVDGAGVLLAGRVRPAVVLPETGARSELVDRGVVTLLPGDEVAGSCFVELTSDDSGSAATWLPSELGVPHDQLVVSPLLAGVSDQALADGSPLTRYQARATGHDWLVLPVVPALVWLLLTRSRRPELALYSLSAARPASIALVLWFEWLGVAVVASVLVVAGVAVAAHGDGVAGAAGLRSVGLCLAVSLTAVLVAGAFTGARRRGEYDLLRSSR